MDFLSYTNLIATLYVIWAGGNDFLFNNTIIPVQIVNSLAISIKALLDAGAKNLLVFNEGWGWGWESSARVIHISIV